MLRTPKLAAKSSAVARWRNIVAGREATSGTIRLDTQKAKDRAERRAGKTSARQQKRAKKAARRTPADRWAKAQRVAARRQRGSTPRFIQGWWA